MKNAPKIACDKSSQAAEFLNERFHAQAAQVPVFFAHRSPGFMEFPGAGKPLWRIFLYTGPRSKAVYFLGSQPSKPSSGAHANTTTQESLQRFLVSLFAINVTYVLKQISISHFNS
jgi:hypothetical protein